MSIHLSHPWNRGGRGRYGRRLAAAFTLVEMLVAMAVTLILIAALAQAFAIVGEAVSQGRAAIELTGGLRSVANQLQEDLQGITVQARPWTDDGSGSGYLEIVEGPERTRLPSTDSDWNGDGTNDTDPTVTNTTLGDVDDILGFTTRNASSPFVGQYVDSSGTVQPLQSSLAEVVWWIQFDDQYVTDPDEANGIQDAGENYLVYRRVLLIRPDLNDSSTGYFKRWTVNDDSPAPNATTSAPGYARLRLDLATFFSQNDVSVRLQSAITGGNLVVTATANSLADLTARENRFAHWPVLSDRSPSVGGNPQYSRPTTTNAVAAATPYDALYLGPFISYAFDVNRRSITSLYRLARPRLLHPDPPTLPLAYANANYGEDVMVSNALSFDVRVFDPYAPVRPGNTGESLVPGDPGYYDAYSSTNLPPTQSQLTSSTTILGLGTFVDLGYGIRSPYPTQCADWSHFSNRPDSKFNPSNLLFNPLSATTHPGNKAGVYEYCTWSTHYERGGNANDGFDNDGQNGVDDVGERTTCPPYPVPLRGIQVKMREIEPESRQIRQVSVVADFIPE
jgi:type II secretory pathway pseudopilin PulG